MTLVVALGNPLREDDGVAWAVAKALEPFEDLHVLSVQQLGPEMAEEVSRAGAVVFVDARRGGLAGELRADALVPAGAAHGLTHVLEPATLLHYAEALYGHAPKKAWLVSIGGERFGLGERLSPHVERTVPRAARLIRGLAHSCLPRTAPGRNTP